MITIAEVALTPIEPEGVRLSGRVFSESNPKLNGKELWWEFASGCRGGAIESDWNYGDPFLAATLLPAMKLGSSLRIEAPVSNRLLGAVPRIQALLHGWWPVMAEVEVKAQRALRVEVAGALGPRRRRFAFFSGGVDALYTALRHSRELSDTDEPIDELLLIRGFDIHLERDHRLWRQALMGAQRVAARCGMELSVCRTNCRVLGNPIVRWEWLHGACLASVAAVRQQYFSTAYIPSSDLRPGEPWGSSPDLDPLWSADTLEIIYDFPAVSRLEKVMAIASSEFADQALSTLRVCHLNPFAAFNCGRCEKCIRTMIQLRVAGALDRCSTFAHPLSLKKIRALRLNDTRFYEKCLDVLHREQRDEPLQLALDAALRRSHRPLRIAQSISWLSSFLRNGFAQFDNQYFRGVFHKIYRTLIRP